jgi:hypothetical protein
MYKGAMKFVLLLLFSFSSLFGVEYANPAPNAAHINSGISVHPLFPKVNPISGEYIEEECDLVVAGCVPLSANRFYHHLAPFSSVYGGWQVNPESSIKANFEKREPPPRMLLLAIEEADASF